jgi:xylulose-5-phosphate/fructose-6-phosphate phosphoketolase
MSAPLSEQQLESMRAYWDAGFNEEGTTTTPFDMVVVNGMSRFHLCKEVLRRCRRSIPNADTLIRRCDAQLARHHDYVREYLDDMPEIRDWTWTR